MRARLRCDWVWSEGARCERQMDGAMVARLAASKGAHPLKEAPNF